MEIHIKTIPMESQRYSTCGDYWYDDLGVLQVRISELGDEFLEKLIMVHELIEEALTKKRGITEEQIMQWDLYYEKRREQGLVAEDSEPGFDKNCPYLREHTFATSVEMGMCALAEEDWSAYDKIINEL